MLKKFLAISITNLRVLFYKRTFKLVNREIGIWEFITLQQPRILQASELHLTKVYLRTMLLVCRALS